MARPFTRVPVTVAMQRYPVFVPDEQTAGRVCVIAHIQAAKLEHACRDVMRGVASGWYPANAQVASEPERVHSDGCDGTERHYRCTRPAAYENENCPGHDDVSGRQGHYVDACCVHEAARRVRERLERPNEDLDVEVWR